MFRQMCKFCQIANTSCIRNRKKYTVNFTRNIYMNMFPNEIAGDENTKVNTFVKSKPIVACKRKEFDGYPETIYKKTETVPIASKGWNHYKSKGDYFTINPVIENEEDNKEDEKFTFENSNLDHRLIDNIKKRGIDMPTTIQKLGIPQIARGQNVIITAETGCGKTLTYLLPIIAQILKLKSTLGERPCNSPLAVIVTPSRELTLQITREAKILTDGLNIPVKSITGGRTKKIVRGAAVYDVDILVGTLGVTSKLTAVHMYKLNFVRHTVIDEAHALFDKTFDEKMCAFLQRINFGFKRSSEKISQSSQLILASATMPQQLPDYFNKYINPESIVNITTQYCHRVLVPQKFLRVGEDDKAPALLKLIKPRAMRREPTIIFSNSSSTSDWISIFLNQMNIKAISLNSKMKLDIRKDKYRKFKNNEINILSTTNAGARGLDTTMVDYVINYDFPLNTAEYINRCGRTGRIGGSANGRVINFVTKPLEIELVQKIERAARRNKPLPMFNIKEQKHEKYMNEELKSLLGPAAKV